MTALGLGGTWLAALPSAASTAEMDYLSRARQHVADLQGWSRPGRAEALEQARRPPLGKPVMGPGSFQAFGGIVPFRLELQPPWTGPGAPCGPSQPFSPPAVHAVGSSAPLLFSPPAAERLGLGPGPGEERPEWMRLRRQFAAALPEYAELIQANELGLVVRCLGRHEALSMAAPGLVQDAATAARVRASLAADPRTRDLPRNVTCETGGVRLHGPFANVAALALAVNAAVLVDGVREVRADLPDDMLVLAAR